VNIKRLRVFERALNERLSSLHPNATGASLAYWHQKKWYSADAVEISDKELRSSLDSARKNTDGLCRPTGDRKVFFWTSKFEAVAVVEFTNAIYAPAQKAVKTALDRITEDSVNEYRATHDSHTGLRNRIAFDQLLVEVLGKFAPQPVPTATLSETNSQPVPKQSVVLASLDIDHFKTINDRFGHGYGDLVLAALAWRMESAAVEIAKEMGGKISVDIFRLGGEEFQLLIAGESTEQEGVTVAKRIAQRIRGEVLPSPAEYERLSRADFADGTPLPHESDRKVTVSVGVATTVGAHDKVTDVGKRLKRQADLALYSAKIGGRDRVRYFGQILESGGHISSVDNKNGIISIDIGKEVGVKKGQEFFVFPPSYDGQTDFYLGEGRSRKRVGAYPRFRAARISAFDVQSEVSFCRVVKREDGVQEIAEGSTLQAIPLGSISHLVGELDGSLKFREQEALRADIASIPKTSAFGVVAVTLRDIEKISEEKGLDKANECLGLVGRHMLAALKSKGKFAQARLGGFLAVLTDTGIEEVESGAEELFNALSAQLEDVAIGVGWSFRSTEKADDEALNDARGLVDAALLAAIESSEEGAAKQFSTGLWVHSLARARIRGEYSRVIADYELFSGFGMQSPTADTQMAFVAMYGPNPNLDSAESFFRQAAGGSDAIDILTVNLGSFLIIVNKIQEGFTLIRALTDLPDSYTAIQLYGALKLLPREEFEQYALGFGKKLTYVMEGKSVWLNRNQLDELIEILKQLNK
jgi:diguanylate cyclase (GGDEF)-like protein